MLAVFMQGYGNRYGFVCPLPSSLVNFASYLQLEYSKKPLEFQGFEVFLS